MTETPRLDTRAALRFHAVIFGAALAVMACQLIHPGYYFLVNFDAAIGPKYVSQVIESFRQGIIYPRWMAEDFGGYGSPIFVYYSPLLFMLGALLGIIGLGIPLSITFLNLLGLYVGGVFLFYLLRGRSGETAALIAALCYILLPGRVADLYFLNTQAGRFCQVFMPMTLYFTARCVEEPISRRNIAGMALSYAALIMSHIATAFIFTPFVVAYGIWGTRGRGRMAPLLRMALGMFSGVCLSAVYFLPASFERGGSQLGVISTMHDYRENFLFYIFQRHAPVQIEGLLTIARWTTVVALVLVLVFYILEWRDINRRHNTVPMFLLACILISTFMMSSPSTFLWERLPGLSTSNTPARYGAVGLLFSSAFLGITVDAYLKRAGRKKAFDAAVFVLLSCIALSDAFLVSKARPYDPEYIHRAIPMVRSEEYLPRTVDLAAADRLSGKDPLLSSVNDPVYNITKWGYADREFTVESPMQAEIRVKTFYFPGWRAWVDGAETQVNAEEGSGAMILTVPRGRHVVSMKFTDTPIRKFGALLSVVTLIALIVPFKRR